MWSLQDSSKNWNSCTMGLWNGTGCLGWVYYTIAKMLHKPSWHALANGWVNLSTSSWRAGTFLGSSLVHLASIKPHDAWWTVAGTWDFEKESKGFLRWISKSQHSSLLKFKYGWIDLLVPTTTNTLQAKLWCSNILEPGSLKSWRYYLKW